MSLYYIDTLLEYVTEPQSSCKHPHRCNPMHFLTSAVSFYCVYFVIERKVRSIYLLIQTLLKSFGFVLQRHTGQNAILQALT